MKANETSHRGKRDLDARGMNVHEDELHGRSVVHVAADHQK